MGFNVIKQAECAASHGVFVLVQVRGCVCTSLRWGGKRGRALSLSGELCVSLRWGRERGAGSLDLSLCVSGMGEREGVKERRVWG